MRTSADLVYLDASALVKLVIRERESDALAAFLRTYPGRISCALSRVEVPRALSAYPGETTAAALALLRTLRLIRLDDELLDRAAQLQPSVLRTLDAIHLAAALGLRLDLAYVITYDRRMADAGRALGLDVVSPGAT